MRRVPALAACCSSVVLALFAGVLTAQPRDLQEGREFAPIAPALATDTGTDRIEVLDVFWYGCPVCNEFEPMMTYWGGEVRGDLVLRRMPAIWNDVMRLHARLYFTAVELQMAPRAHREAFLRIHGQQQALNNEAAIQEFFAQLGVDAEKFAAAWNAAAVQAAVQRAEQETQAAGVDRLPALIVNGRYRVVRNAAVPELPELVIAANELIKRERDLRRPD
jgi:thiol:disulfide interchange protein DsbA